MADQLFKKRKAREAKDFKRKEAKEDPYKKILIICEGSKTEPNYFKKLVKDHYRIPTAKVEVRGEECDSAPSKIVDFTLKKLKKNEEYDGGVFCVFDRDTHDDYNPALKKIREHNQHPKNKQKITAITSVPCFEIWLLLHIKNTAKPYGQEREGNTPAKELLSYLKTEDPFKNYAKNDIGYFDKIIDKIGIAIENSKKLLEEGLKTTEDRHHIDPSTLVHELIETLKDNRPLYLNSTICSNHS